MVPLQIIHIIIIVIGTADIMFTNHNAYSTDLLQIY